ncbi:hypothetical protein HQ533_03745 [Candidatus Woesearchaeota archaeon]|nr:hypothetical protein [Candidatus Woesearchaeota archaeon]
MKIKRTLILLIVLVLFTQIVSAGFFDNFFNMITGSVIENTTTEPECTDSDDGKDYFVRGTVNFMNKDYRDTCQLGDLKEFYCEDGIVKEEIVDCYCASEPELFGVCIEEATCDDTEHPSEQPEEYQDPYVKGELYLTFKNRAGLDVEKVVEDVCRDKYTDRLLDYSCRPNYDGLVRSGWGTDIICEYGCEDGVCLEEGMTEPEPEEPIVEEPTPIDLECLKEGEPYEQGGDKQCCEGLNAISASVGDGRICSLTAGYYCSPCGNGVCEGGESTCNCLEDCPCEEGKAYSYTCRDGTEIPMCECSNGKWDCVTAPENQCPAQVCGNEICEGDELETCPQDCQCGCPDTPETVCGNNGVTYTNSCNALCGGTHVACNGACPCPVCGNGICERNENIDNCPDDCKEEGDCRDNIDCPIKMKCKNSVCVDVGCIQEGGTSPGAISPEYIYHMATECCEGLITTAYFGNYDEKCNFVILAGGPSGVCTKCGDGQCGKGETECNCPDDCISEPPPDVPPGCKRVIRDDGMEEVKCERQCPEIPEQAIKKCEETDGKAEKRFDPNGCPFIECEYAPVQPPGRVGCPSEELLNEMRKKCLSIDLEPISIKKEECEFIKCSGKGEVEDKCAGVETPGVKEECMKKGGKIVKDFDPNGCSKTICVPAEEEEFECKIDLPSKTYDNCEYEGGNIVMKRDDEGCIRFVECAKRGNQDVVYEKVDEVPSAANLLSVALKLESLKVEIDKMIRKLRGLANYYDDLGNAAEANKFRKVAGLFSNANDKIEDIKANLRETARDMTKEDLRDLKHDIKYVSEVVMEDALYIILGGEIKLEGSVGVTEEGYADCGDDSGCWSEAFRICEPALFKPGNMPGFEVVISGVDDEVCILEVTYQDMDMVCEVEDYTTAEVDGVDIFQYCEGSLFGWVQEQMSNAPPPPEVPKNCEDMVDTGEMNDCYIELAGRTGDSDVCEKITVSSRKDKCYAAVAEEQPTEGVTSKTLRSVEGSLLYFYNENCPHCEKQEPEITRIEKYFGTLIKIERLNTEKDSEIFAKYNIEAVPSFVYIGLDECTSKKIGYTEYKELREWIYSDECTGGVS